MSRIKTKKEQIIEWGQNNIDEAGYGCDASEMSTHCWRCGHDDVETERCHVIPHSLGGEDTPSNYRLLCKDCHKEAPNVNDVDEMDKWIRRTCVPYYNTFWKVREAYKEAYKEVSWHFGVNELNESTSKWVIKRVLELINEKIQISVRESDTWVFKPIRG